MLEHWALSLRLIIYDTVGVNSSFKTFYAILYKRVAYIRYSHCDRASQFTAVNILVIIIF